MQCGPKLSSAQCAIELIPQGLARVASRGGAYAGKIWTPCNLGDLQIIIFLVIYFFFFLSPPKPASLPISAMRVINPGCGKVNSVPGWWRLLHAVHTNTLLNTAIGASRWLRNINSGLSLLRATYRGGRKNSFSSFSRPCAPAGFPASSLPPGAHRATPSPRWHARAPLA